jgi:hypothetical protein
MTEQPGPPTEHLDPADPRAAAAVRSVQSGDVATLRDLLSLHPGLPTARIGTPRRSRTLLHVGTDWPGHFPNGPQTTSPSSTPCWTPGPTSRVPGRCAPAPDLGRGVYR